MAELVRLRRIQFNRRLFRGAPQSAAHAQPSPPTFDPDPGIAADSAAWIGADPTPDRPDVPIRQLAPAAALPPPCGPPGLPFSLRGLLKNPFVQRQLGHQSRFGGARGWVLLQN
jgi:hypothetical protein